MNLVERTASKVPEVTLVFWIIKIAATTLGETAGDTVTMTLNWGYLLGTALFLSLLVIFVILQIAAKKFHPYLYWATIVASTTAGTTMADFADRSLGIGYAGGSSLLFDFVEKVCSCGSLFSLIQLLREAGLRIMMGHRQVEQAALFYEFSLERHVPADHLLRSIDRFVELEDVRRELAAFYSTIGRPSIDPELMIRMLIVGYCFGIRSERRLCEEVHLNLAYRWFL